VFHAKEESAKNADVKIANARVVPANPDLALFHLQDIIHIKGE
jgi:hypothetical protein